MELSQFEYEVEKLFPNNPWVSQALRNRDAIIYIWLSSLIHQHCSADLLAVYQKQSGTEDLVKSAADSSTASELSKHCKDMFKDHIYSDIPESISYMKEWYPELFRDLERLEEQLYIFTKCVIDKRHYQLGMFACVVDPLFRLDVLFSTKFYSHPNLKEICASADQSFAAVSRAFSTSTRDELLSQLEGARDVIKKLWREVEITLTQNEFKTAVDTMASDKQCISEQEVKRKELADLVMKQHPSHIRLYSFLSQLADWFDTFKQCTKYDISLFTKAFSQCRQVANELGVIVLNNYPCLLEPIQAIQEELTFINQQFHAASVAEKYAFCAEISIKITDIWSNLKCFLEEEQH